MSYFFVGISISFQHSDFTVLMITPMEYIAKRGMLLSVNVKVSGKFLLAIWNYFVIFFLFCKIWHKYMTTYMYIGFFFTLNITWISSLVWWILNMNLETCTFFHFFFLECHSGFIGLNCTSKCRYPSYGRACQNECNCNKIACNPSTGCEGMFKQF